MNRLFIAGAACAAGFTVFGTLTEFTDIQTASLSQTGNGVKATTYADTENLAAATFTGVPDRCRARAKIEGGKLVVTVKPIKGLVLIIQ